MRHLLLVFVALALVAPCSAQTLRLDEPVPGHRETTVGALLGSVVPGLTISGGMARGEVELALPHLVGQDYVSDRPVPVEFGHVTILDIEAEGADRLLLFGDLGSDGAAILALFDASLALLDAIQVATDRFTSLGEVPLLRIGPQDHAVVASSTHWNSSQSYGDTLLVFVRDGKFRLIDSIFTFSDRICGAEQAQSLGLAAEEEEQGAPWPIIATVTEVRPLSDECESDEPLDPPFTRLISTTYRWNASLGAYRADSDALVDLAQQSSERF